MPFLTHPRHFDNLFLKIEVTGMHIVTKSVFLASFDWFWAWWQKIWSPNLEFGSFFAFLIYPENYKTLALQLQSTQ